MADAFSSDLSGVAAPRRADSFGNARLVRPQGEPNIFGAVIDIGSTLLSGALEIREQERNRGLQGEVADSILDSLSDLRKFKEVGNQRGDGTQQFNLRLAAKAKELRVRGFDPDLINKAFRDEGFLPPKAALFNEIAEGEKREEIAQAAREEGVLDSAFEQGMGVVDKNGNPDRDATIELMQIAARATAALEKTMAGLGVIRKASGELSETARFVYFQKRPQIRKDLFSLAMVGLRIPVNKLQTMLRTATLSDIGEIKKQMLDVVGLADRFRLEQFRNSSNLNKPEQDDHMAYVDSVLVALTGGILELKDAKDLNTMKSMTFALDWANRHIDIINIEDFPTIVRMGRVSEAMVPVFVSVGLGATGMRAKIQRQISGELETFLDRKPPIKDMLPPNTAPKATDMSVLGSDEAQYSEKERLARIQFSIDAMSKLNENGVGIQKDTDAFAWLKLQGPLFNARNNLTSNDKGVIADQMTGGNYLKSLMASLVFFPVMGAATGSYAFDIVQQDLQNNVREMRRLGGFGTLGRDFEIVYDKLSKKFIVQDTEGFKLSALTVEEGLGTPKEGTFAGLPGIEQRMDRINKDVDFMLSTRQFKDVFKDTTDAAFLEDTGAFIKKDITDVFTTPVIGVPNVQLKGGEFPVSLEGLKPEILSVIDIAAPMFEELGVPLVITSTTKNEDPNSKQHKKDSKHFIGQAIDLRSRQLAPENQQRILKQLQQALGPDFFVDLEIDHFHIEFDRKEKT